MKASQPTLPGVRDWTQPQTVRGSELVAVIAEAKAAGWHAHKMRALPETIYELRFFRVSAEGISPVSKLGGSHRETLNERR
jgi:hypothetical protein